MTELTILRLAGAWSSSLPGYKARIERWCRAALPQQAKAVSVVLADDEHLRAMNHQFRGKNKPTNILSFNGEGDELGDMVLAYETIKKEAREQRKRFADHVAHLVIHGCLHLLGHDHEQEDERDDMEAREIAILSTLGIADPYEVAA